MGQWGDVWASGVMYGRYMGPWSDVWVSGVIYGPVG